MPISSDILRGHLDAIILRLILEKDRYGYEIAKEIARRTGGGFEIKEATLYAAIQRLERNRYLVSYSGQVTHGRARKYYKATPAGEAYFLEQRCEWQATRNVIDQLMEENRDAD